jgi:CheY-like chemotaxis protein
VHFALVGGLADGTCSAQALAEEISRSENTQTLPLLLASRAGGDLEPVSNQGWLRTQTLPPLFSWAELTQALAVPHGAIGEDAESGTIPHTAVTPAPRKILLVEDCMVNREVAIGLLELRGHVVSAATTGGEALETLRQATFDVVLMDLEMPDMDGVQATRLFRQSGTPEAVRTPVIAMTAHAQQGYEAICLAAGMDGYVTKPIDPPALYAAVERAARAVGNSMAK